jgi:hypothetical protein
MRVFARRLTALVAFMAIFIAASPLSAQTSAPAHRAPQAEASTADVATQTVYVTKTGAKYHRAGCRYLSKSAIPMTLKDAAARYSACSICHPPVLAAATAAPTKASNPKPAAPDGATAQCRDGSYSFSAHRSGTCSHHGGVAKWLH